MYRDVASGADSHLDITFRLQVVESSSLVSVLFREGFSDTYISFLHLVLNVFYVVIIIINLINFFRWVFSEYTEVINTSFTPLGTSFPDKCAFIIGFSCTVYGKQ